MKEKNEAKKNSIISTKSRKEIKRGSSHNRANERNIK